MKSAHKLLGGREDDVGSVLKYRCCGEVPSLHRAAHSRTPRPHSAAHLYRHGHHHVLIYFHCRFEQPRYVHAFQFSSRNDSDTVGFHSRQLHVTAESLRGRFQQPTGVVRGRWDKVEAVWTTQDKIGMNAGILIV